MELREIRSLVALAEAGSIAHAAKLVSLTPPAVYAHLKSLATDFGVRVYERRGNRLVITQEAAVLVPEMQALLSQYESVLHRLDEWKGLKRGVIRIGAGPSIASDLLPSFIDHYCRTHAGIDLLIETGTGSLLTEKLAKGMLDFTLQPFSVASAAPELSVQATWDFEVVLVTALRNVPRSCNLVELQDFPFVLFGRGFTIGDLVESYLAEFGFNPHVLVRSDNAPAMRSIVRKGIGISLLPVWTVRADLRGRRLRKVNQRERRLFVKVALVARKSAFMSARLHRFVELARTFDWNQVVL